MSSYKHFTMAEREESMILLRQEKGIREIARKLGRTPSSVSREISRNRKKDGTYSADTAYRKYCKRRENCGRKPKVSTNPELKQYIEERLQLYWSPEVIAGKMRLGNEPFSVSYNTIYRAIEKGVLSKRFRTFLRFKRIKNKKKKSDDRRGQILGGVSIRERPQAANDRTEPGHFESDTVLGKRGTGILGTHVERMTGYLYAFKIPDRKDNAFIYASAELFRKIPKGLKKTFTVDNGLEFYDHALLTRLTGMNVYFCDPCSPWQRGLNENTNGLLRQFFPKGTSLADVTDEKLQHVVDLINNRPRKRFGFRSPAELLQELLESPQCCT